MLRRLVAGALALGGLILLLWLAAIAAVPVRAHDSWISRGGLRNPVTSEWCCGEGDCFPLPEGTVAVRADGYHVLDAPGGATLEVVPFPESQPSPDGAYWRCKRPDGTRRCFFAPPPNT